MAMKQDSSVLDTLRAIAVLLVLVDHICETVAPIHPYDWYMGRLGVLLFFVHTSCVLMMSMQRTPMTGLPLARHFYIRRAFRIYPLSILTVAVVLMVGVPQVAWSPELPDRSVLTVVANLLLVQDLVGAHSVSAPLWSLPLEIQMYVLLPGIFILINRGASLSRALGLWIFGVLVAVLVPSFGPRLPLFVPCFLSGIIGFCLSQRVKPRMPFWIWPIALIGLATLYTVLSSASDAVHSEYAAWLTCLAAGILLPTVRETTSWIRHVSRVIATYSYGIYLAHMPALWVAFVVLGDWPIAAQWAMFFVLLAGASVLAYHALEQPMVRLGNRIANRAQPSRTGNRAVVAVR